MSQKVERKFAHGTYKAEFLKEMEPFGEDRQTQFIPDTPPDKITSLAGRTLEIFCPALLMPFPEDSARKSGKSRKRLCMKLAVNGEWLETGKKRAAKREISSQEETEELPSHQDNAAVGCNSLGFP